MNTEIKRVFGSWVIHYKFIAYLYRRVNHPSWLWASKIKRRVSFFPFPKELTVNNSLSQIDVSWALEQIGRDI